MLMGYLDSHLLLDQAAAEGLVAALVFVCSCSGRETEPKKEDSKEQCSTLFVLLRLYS
jgi:hypothetical protein